MKIENPGKGMDSDHKTPPRNDRPVHRTDRHAQPMPQSEAVSSAWERGEALLALTGILNNNGAFDERAVVRKIAEEAAQMTQTRMALIYLYDDEGDFSYAVSTGLSMGFAREMEKLGRTEWLANYVAGADRPSEIRILPEPPYPSPIHRLAASEDIGRIVSIPIPYHDKLLGVIMLFDEKGREYGAADFDFLTTLSNMAALTLSHVRLIETRKWERKAQDQFLDALSHELRTPLTSILGFTQIIRQRFNGGGELDKRTRDQFDLLWAQAQRLNRLLDTFVDVANIERGDFAIQHNRVDISGLLRGAVVLSKQQARSEQELVLDIPDQPVWIHADTRRLEHVFNHIISNALKYSPQDKSISVTCQANQLKDEIVILVADQGGGIPADTLREVFQRFYPSETRKMGGMGIGLYASKAIVEAHGGQLTLESAQGKGTIVRIILPI